MLHRATCCLKTVVVIAIALGVALPASADQPLTRATPPEQHSRDVLARLDASPGKSGWFTDLVEVDYSSGIRISWFQSYGNHRFDLRLRGPLYKTPVRKRNYGLKLELKF